MKRRLLAGLVGLLLAAALVGIDHRLGHADRVALAARQGDLLSVRDALCHFEHATGRLPGSLDELAPRLLRPDQLRESTGQPRYRYDPRARVIATARGFAIHGLITHRRDPLRLAIPATAAPAPAAGTTPASAELLLPASPKLPPPPAGAYVFEAELYSATNYGWEVHPDAACGGGAYLHIKEGMANGPGQFYSRIFDFYGVEEKQEYTYLKIHFHLPKAGRYYLYGRMWTTGSHCSNNLNVGIDRGGLMPGKEQRYYGRAMYNVTPFAWVWTRCGGRYDLAAGDHYLHIFPHEDGIRVDQFMLCPRPGRGNRAFAANLPAAAGTAFAAQAPAPLLLGFDLKSMVITPGLPLSCRLSLRRLRRITGKVRVRVVLEQAAGDGAELVLLERELAGDALPPLAFLPLLLPTADLKRLRPREYLLAASATLRGKVLARARVPLMVPYHWEVCDCDRYIANGNPGPLDGDRAPTPPKAWTPFKETSWDHFGVMDFGLQVSGNSLHAPENRTIYARTVLYVPRTDTYLLKIQADDQLLLWIDGAQVYRHDQVGPVTRSAKRLPWRLQRGVHAVRIRVNQGHYTQFRDGRWQASLRLRTREDRVAQIVGLSPRPGK